MSAITTQHNPRLLAWLGLTLIDSWGPAKVWHAVGDPPHPLSAWQRESTPQLKQRLQEALQNAEAAQAQIITWDDQLYPMHLHTVHHPPPVLFVQGTLEPEDSAAVALVGSRRASPQAQQLSFILARDLAQCGITVVSGLATGVDAAAHRGALAGGGRTIAVVACGVDHVYPPAHKGLAQQISAQGAIISQFPCSTSPLRSHFPIRNRTIAGMTLATVVVEAAEKSGALITAKHAAEMGREVLACPGDVLREHTKGSNHLLRDGAHYVESASDIIYILQRSLSDVLASLQTKGNTTPTEHRTPNYVALPLALEEIDVGGVKYPKPPVHVKVWESLLNNPGSSENLMSQTGMGSIHIRRALGELELLGYVQRVSPDHYMVCNKGPTP
jgi:DNA processing protein